MSRLSDPKFKEPIYLVGYITLALSHADLLVEQLTELYLGEGAARAVIAEFGRNRDKSGLLKSLISETEADPKLATALNACLDAYSIHRENRNKLVHAFSIEELENGNLRWNRASGKIKNPLAGSDLSEINLKDMVKQVECLNGLLAQGMFFKAQCLGNQPFLGSIARPLAPALPHKFPDIGHPAHEGAPTSFPKRAPSRPASP